MMAETVCECAVVNGRRVTREKPTHVFRQAGSQKRRKETARRDAIALQKRVDQALAGRLGYRAMHIGTPCSGKAEESQKDTLPGRSAVADLVQTSGGEEAAKVVLIVPSEHDGRSRSAVCACGDRAERL